MSPSTSDEDVLIPQPAIFKVADKEVRIAPLSVRRVKEVIRAVENNKDLVEKLPTIMDVGVVVFLDGEVYRRLNEFVRLVVSPKEAHAFLTDEWCEDHLTNSHYRAFFMTVLKQNELYGVFLKAKAFIGANVDGALRQAMMTHAPEAKVADPTPVPDLPQAEKPLN